MLFYKLFSSFKIDEAINFFKYRQVAWEVLGIFPRTKIPFFLIIIIRSILL